MFSAWKDGSYYGVINERGEEVVAPISERMISEMDGVCILEKENKKAYYHSGWAKLSGFVYEDIVPILGGRALLVKAADGWFAKVKSGEVIADHLQTSYYPGESNGMLAVKNDAGKWGYLKFE